MSDMGEHLAFLNECRVEYLATLLVNGDATQATQRKLQHTYKLIEWLTAGKHNSPPIPPETPSGMETASTPARTEPVVTKYKVDAMRLCTQEGREFLPSTVTSQLSPVVSDGVLSILQALDDYETPTSLDQLVVWIYRCTEIVVSRTSVLGSLNNLVADGRVLKVGPGLYQLPQNVPVLPAK